MKTHFYPLLSIMTMSMSVWAAAETGTGHSNSDNKATPEQPTPSIPMDQLGAVAQKQYSGDGISITSTADGAKLSAAFQKLKGNATPEGLWLESTAEVGDKSERFRVLASVIGRQEGSVDPFVRLPKSGIVQATPESAVFARPGLVEEYRVSMDGVRQDFVILDRPSGEGQLSVTLEVTGAQVAAAPYGAKLTLKGSSREIAYCRLHVTDATGRELTATLEVLSPERLAVRVIDDAAIYPVRIDPTFSDADWVSLNPGMPGANYTVSAMVVDGSSNLYVGGQFTFIGTVAANRIAKWNGSAWSALGLGMNNTVSALAVSGSDLYAGGSFITAGGITVNRIAKWNGSEWSALGSGMNGEVAALAVSGSDLYVGGTFGTAGGATANYIAKWNGSAWSALGSGMNSNVAALAVGGSGLYAGGFFTMAGSTTVKYIAKWNGSAWSALGAGIDGSVHALAVSGNDIYAGGNFTTASGTFANYIAKWNGSTWSALGSGWNNTVTALAVIGSDIYAGGLFTGGSTTNYIAKWNGSAWSRLGTGMDWDVAALAVIGSSLYAGGGFGTAGGTTARCIAKWDGSAWSALGTGMNSTVYALAVSGNDLYAGGSFGTVGSTAANRIAKWNGNTWSALGSGLNGSSPYVCALAVSSGDLYVGGSFTTAGGTTARNIAKWDGRAWLALGSGINGSFAAVNALAVSGSNLYAGGYFTTAGGTSVNSIAKWNGSAWSALGSGMNNTIRALAVGGSDLYAGGDFTTAGGMPASCVAKWNGSVWSALDTGLNGIAQALAVSGSDLYAGGNFTTAGGTAASRVAKWNGSAWSALGTGMNISPVYALAVSGSDLYAGGGFTAADGTTVNRIAKWNGSAWSALGTGMDSAIRALAADSTGRLYLGGDFVLAGSTVSPFIAQANIGIIAPEIAIESPVNTNIADGGSKSFGTIVVGANTSLTFTIKNIGTANLTGLTLTKDGTDAGLFTVTSYPTAPVSGPSGSTTFTVKFAPTSAGSKVAALHIANNDSDENPFDITLTGSAVAASGVPVSLAVYGPASVSSGGSATYTCQATYAGGTVADVTSLCVWQPASAFPSGVQLINNKLSVPYGVQAGTAGLMARYSSAGGALSSAPVSIVIVGGWVPLIQQAFATPVAGSSPAQWLVSTLGTTFGDSPSPMTVHWELNGGTISNANGIVNNVPVSGVTGTRTITFIVSDGDGVTKMTSQQLVFNKPPVANQPVASFRAADIPSQGPLIQDSLGTPLQYDSAKTDVGLIVLVHGMNDTALSRTGQGTWLTIMRYDIEQCLQRAGKPLPNIGIYDWSDVSFPSKLPGYDQSTLDQITGDNGRFVYDLTHIKAWAVSSGVLLKRRILAEIDAGHINSNKPIHFIGHSAGGFVIGEAATRLQQQRGVIVDLVTMLDTPDPVNGHFKTFPNGPGTVERYISSWAGLIQYKDKIGEYDVGTATKDALWDYLATKAGLSWLGNITPNPAPNSSIAVPGPYYRREVVPLWDYYRNDIIEAHTESRRWYDWNTVMGQTQSGFWNSPFYHGAPVNRNPAPMIQSVFSTPESAGPASSPSTATVTKTPISSFDSFGSVTENSGVFTLTEQDDVGIFKTMALPVGAMTLRFLYQCTSAGDGDLLSVRFGDRPPLCVVPETAADTVFLTAEVSMGDLAGLTDQLVIELVSRGNANAVVQVKQIELDETDDPDGDRLSTSQEQAIGTNPLLYDTDSDGISDWAEVNTTLTNPLNADSDGDGMGDAQEIIAGTNGMDASSVFRTTGTTVAANGAVAITWAAKAGKTYNVQRSDTPDFTNYTVLGNNIAGVEPTTSFTDSTVQSGTTRMFYRVQVE